MTHVGKHHLVADRARAKLLDVGGQARGRELARVVLEQAGHVVVDQVKRQTMEVADIGDDRRARRPHACVFEGADDGRRGGVHQQ